MAKTTSQDDIYNFCGKIDETGEEESPGIPKKRRMDSNQELELVTDSPDNHNVSSDQNNHHVENVGKRGDDNFDNEAGKPSKSKKVE